MGWNRGTTTVCRIGRSGLGVVREFEPALHEEVIREFLQAIVDEDICIGEHGLTEGLSKCGSLILDWATNWASS